MPLEAPPFKWALFSMLVQMPVDPTTHSAFGVASLLENGDGLIIDDKFPIIRLDCSMEIELCRIILELLDNVIEVSKWVTDGNSVHFVRADGSPRDLCSSSQIYLL